MWLTAFSTTTSYTSFGSQSTFASEEDLSTLRSQSKLQTKTTGVSMLNSLEPVDYHEYLNQVFSDDENTVSDVESTKSLQLNLRPTNMTEIASATIYATFGMSIAHTLDRTEDPEGEDIVAIVHNSANYKLSFWVNERRT